MEKKFPMSDSLTVGALLTLAGGFLEAYSFLTRDQVLANCQSGNLIFTALFAVQGQWNLALRWFAPVCAFVVGVFLTEWVRDRFTVRGRLHWRQLVLLLEIALIFAAGVLPMGRWNVTATVLISFACAMQADAFKTLRGSGGYATIMCTGNLRSALLHLYNWKNRGRKDAAEKARDYFLIIGCFMAGSALGTGCVFLLGDHACWVCCLLQAGAFGMMIERRQSAPSSNPG